MINIKKKELNSKNKIWSLLDITWLIFLAISYVFSSTFRVTTKGSVLMLVFITFMHIIRKKSLGLKPLLSCLMWYTFFTIWVSYLFFYGKYVSNSANTIIETMILNIIILICLIYYLISENRIERFLYIIVYATVFFALMYLITSPISTYGTTGMGGITGVWRTAAGYYTCYAGIIAVFLYFSESKSINMLLSAIICLVTAICTGSRKVIIQIILAIILFVILQNNIKKKVKTLLIIIALGIIGMIVMFQIPFFQEFYGERLLAIFDTNIVDSSVSGRNYLKDTAMQLFHQSPIIGNGVDAVRYYLDLIGYQWATYSHNNYAEILSSYGIIGLIIYYFYIVKKTIISYKNRNMDNKVKLFLILLILYLVLDIGSVSYYMRMYIITIAFPLFSLEYYSMKSKKQKCILKEDI